MSFWQHGESQRQIHDMKQRYMNDVLRFNKQVMDQKQQRKQKEIRDFETYSHRANQEALTVLMHENDRTLRKQQEQKEILRQSYERQMKEREEKERTERERDAMFYSKHREHLQYEEARRVQDLAKMFNRVTYQAVPIGNHRRSRTQTDERQYSSRNPESNQNYLQRPSEKSLNGIEVRLIPTPTNRQANTPSRPSPAQLQAQNFSFHGKERR